MLQKENTVYRSGEEGMRVFHQYIMTNFINHEQEFPAQRRTREETPASTARVATFTLEIPDDTATFREMILKELRDIIFPLCEVIAEIFQSIHFLASEEDQTMLLEFSTGILIIHWILSTNADSILSPFMDTFSMPPSEMESPITSTTRLMLKLIDILEVALENLDSVTNANSRENNFTFFIKNGTMVGRDDGSKFSFSSPTNSDWIDTTIPNINFPTALMVIGPLAVIILTCIMADNKYYIFATMFAPTVDRVLLRMRSFFAPSVSSQEDWQHQRIPDNSEASEGVLWGMLVLFCLESILVGSILALMVLISVSLTIIASSSTVVSSRENPELLEEITKMLVVCLFSWIICVVTTNILRMVLYQTIDNDD